MSIANSNSTSTRVLRRQLAQLLVAYIWHIALCACATQKHSLLKCHSAPYIHSPLANFYSSNTTIDIDCQTTGSVYHGTSTWIKTSDGCFVTSAYLQVAPAAIQRCAPVTGAPCTAINRAGIELIKRGEGFVPTPSQDITGAWVVGHGHRCAQANCTDMRQYAFPLASHEAEAVLTGDLAQPIECLRRVVRRDVRFNENQWAALVSWAFNVECAAVGGSALVRGINGGRSEGLADAVEDELPRWSRFGGRVYRSLRQRRRAEVELFRVPAARVAHPICQL